MGCDGGTIPRRDELVKVKAKTETKDKDSELAFQWRCCYLSQQILQSPVVMCRLGHLYNKVALIEGLLNAKTLPDNVKHIKSLKDVKNLNLTPNPEYKPSDNKKTQSGDSGAAPYICPVIGLEMTGNYRFVGLWTCGCVFSERALKEISAETCYKCQIPFESHDVIILNGNEEDISLMKQNMEEQQQKNKKDRKKKATSPPSTSTSSSTENMNKEQKINTVTTDKSWSSSSSSSSSLSSSNGLPSTQANSTITKQICFKRPGITHTLSDKIKKIKREYSVAKDPQASDVYKSLFTTHESQQQQNRAHWITYNPFYN